MIDAKIADQVLLMMETATLPGGTATRAAISWLSCSRENGYST